MKTKKRFNKAKLASLTSLGLLTSTGIIAPLTSCSLLGKWDWNTASKGSTKINYCLLIGQNDHSDSIERTRYTRKALGTLDESEATKTRTKDNPNIAEPIQGHIELEVKSETKGTKTFELEVNEIEHMEQKSMAGATWDSITANNTASTWIAKHGKDITFFVSNNDGMAEGAYWASNWIEGMPIFGYDANSTTLEWIKAGKITGTVDQNASTQAASAMMMMRNMLEDRDDFWTRKVSDEKNGYFGTTNYKPGWRGFYKDKAEYEKAEYQGKDKHGFVHNGLISKASEWDIYKTEEGKNSKRDCLAASTAIDSENVNEYFKEDGTVKKPADMFDQFTSIEKTTPSTRYTVCQTFASLSEAYLIATLKPYFDEYASRLGFDVDQVMGDGTDEAVIINKFVPVPDEKYQGYLINMVKTTATNAYITAIAKKAFANEKAKGHKSGTLPADGWDKFEDRLDTPVIFWNRQPHNDQGAIDRDIVNNKFFKYVYFVGVDASGGGEVQGEVILNNIKRWIKADWEAGKIN